MEGSVQIVRQQLEDVYERQILIPNYLGRKTHRDTLKSRARDFLDLANPSERLDADITRVLLDQSATIPSWGSVSCVMLCMEQYAINLLNYPWKKEFHKILTYSGFYKTKLKSCLQDSALEKLFSIIWYQQIANTFVLKSSPQRSVLLHAAFGFYLAAIECENYNKVHAVFESRGLSTVGAMQFRIAHHGNVKACCTTINRRYNSRTEEQGEELIGRSVVPSYSVDVDTCMTTGEWKSPFATDHSATVERSSFWDCTGTLEEHAETSRELLTELQPQNRSLRVRQREVAGDFEQLKLEPGSVVSAFNDSSIYKSFSTAKLKKLAERHSSQLYDKPDYEDCTGFEISKEQQPKQSSLTGRENRQGSFHEKWIERLDGVSAGDSEEVADAEYCRFSSIQDCRTNSELAQNQKTNRQLSINDQSNQMVSEKRERSRRLKRLATQKSGMVKVQQFERETETRQRANVTQHEKRRDSETHNVNLEQQCSGGMEPWQCEACTLVNKPSDSICSACNRSRNCADETPLKTGGRQCNQCTFVNPSSAEKCEICDTDLIGSSTYV